MGWIKRFCVLLMLITVTVVLTACGNSTIDERFECILDNNPSVGVFKGIIIDKETGVLYLKYGGGITVLVDQNGKPLLYKEDLQWEMR